MKLEDELRIMKEYAQMMLDRGDYRGLMEHLKPFAKKHPPSNSKHFSPAMRFLEKVKKSDNDCWIWLGGKKENGYGTFQYKGKLIGAHRAAYLMWKGEIPSGYYVCHTCDNPSCVNYNHLWVGTNSENIQDAKRKGRLSTRKGYESDEGITRKKLQARIRRRRYNAKKYGYDYSTEKEDIARLHSLKA